MVENEEITGTMRAEGENDPVSEFIGKFYSQLLFYLSNRTVYVIFYSLLHKSDDNVMGYLKKIHYY